MTTLFLLQGDYAKAQQLLMQFQQMATNSDSIVLMAESVLHYNHPSLAPYRRYVLENDAVILPKLENDLAQRIQCIDYLQFSQLILQHQRCISLK